MDQFLLVMVYLNSLSVRDVSWDTLVTLITAIYIDSMIISKSIEILFIEVFFSK